MTVRRRHAKHKKGRSFASKVKKVLFSEAETKFLDTKYGATQFVGPSSISATPSYALCPNIPLAAGTSENQRIGAEVRWKYCRLNLLFKSGANVNDLCAGFMRIIVGWSKTPAYGNAATTTILAGLVEASLFDNNTVLYTLQPKALSTDISILYDEVVNLNHTGTAPFDSTLTGQCGRLRLIERTISLKNKKTQFISGTTTGEGSPFVYLVSTDSLSQNHGVLGQIRWAYTDV